MRIEASITAISSKNSSSHSPSGKKHKNIVTAEHVRASEAQSWLTKENSSNPLPQIIVTSHKTNNLYDQPTKPATSRPSVSKARRIIVTPHKTSHLQNRLKAATIPASACPAIYPAVEIHRHIVTPHKMRDLQKHSEPDMRSPALHLLCAPCTFRHNPAGPTTKHYVRTQFPLTRPSLAPTLPLPRQHAIREIAIGNLRAHRAPYRDPASSQLGVESWNKRQTSL